MADDTAPTPLDDLRKICDEIAVRWDSDMRPGKLLYALMGRVPGYRADATRVLEALQPTLYLVWSNEHRAWWAPDHRGYTRQVDRAGRYTRDEAIAIASTRGGGWPSEGNPYEIAIPERDAIAQAAKVAADCAKGGVE